MHNLIKGMLHPDKPRTQNPPATDSNRHPQGPDYAPFTGEPPRVPMRSPEQGPPRHPPVESSEGIRVHEHIDIPQGFPHRQIRKPR